MKKLINLIDNLSGIGGWVAGILMAVALVISVGEIIFRSFLHSTLYVADEYTGYLMAMLTFMGLAYTLRERGHIRMMFLPHFIKGRAHVIFNMVCFTVGFLFCVGLTAYTWEFFWDSVVNQIPVHADLRDLPGDSRGFPADRFLPDDASVPGRVPQRHRDAPPGHGRASDPRGNG